MRRQTDQRLAGLREHNVVVPAPPLIPLEEIILAPALPQSDDSTQRQSESNSFKEQEQKPTDVTIRISEPSSR
jgi:hypothetical protein